MIWIQFFICGTALTWFSYHLCREGVLLSERTNISEGIIGMIFLAIATSFPEISTAATSVYFLGKTGLGYSDIVGSVIVNFMILFGLDYFAGKGRILLRISGLNRMTGIVVAILASMVFFAALLRMLGVPVPSMFGIGVESFLIVFVYLAAMLRLKHLDVPDHSVVGETKDPGWEIWGKFLVLLGIVVILGAWMAKIGEEIVILTGLSQTFTGVIFLGIATSLPEIIVTFAALRAGSLDMAVGNVLGSNMFDICVIPFLDLLNRVPILGVLTLGQVVIALVMMLISVVFLAGTLMRRDTSSRLNWDTSVIFAIGFLGFVIIYFVH